MELRIYNAMMAMKTSSGIDTSNIGPFSHSRIVLLACLRGCRGVSRCLERRNAQQVMLVTDDAQRSSLLHRLRCDRTPDLAFDKHMAFGAKRLHRRSATPDERVSAKTMLRATSTHGEPHQKKCDCA